MTEKQFQLARTVMAKAKRLRDIITQRKLEVSKWTAAEHNANLNMEPGKAAHYNKLVLLAIEKLKKARKDFSDLKLPTDE